MKTTAIILGLFLTSAFAQVQTEPVDPGGCNKAKWGMKQSQILNVFPEAKLYEVPGIERGSKRLVFGLRGFQIERMKFEVRFYFDADERLKEVGLSPEGGETKIRGITTLALPAKDNLLIALTDKYGKPDAKAPERTGKYSISYEWEWLFPKTAITLRCVDFGEGEGGILSNSGTGSVKIEARFEVHQPFGDRSTESVPRVSVSGRDLR
jgi:hypothetical protein